MNPKKDNHMYNYYDVEWYTPNAANVEIYIWLFGTLIIATIVAAIFNKD